MKAALFATVSAFLFSLAVAPRTHKTNGPLSPVASDPEGNNKIFYKVRDRKTNQQETELIPLLVRSGITLMFNTPLVDIAKARAKLEKETRDAATEYDSPGSVKKIAKFVKNYKIDMTEFDPTDTKAYKTFNEFFYRHVRPEKRPLAMPDNPNVLVSAADCRLNVFDTITKATQTWIKGDKFTLAGMLKDDALARDFEGGSMVIFRLAPQDYHRFHAPVDGQVLSVQDVTGTYFSVNPMVVRANNNVFTENKRSVAVIQSPQFGKVAFVAVGAAMVGSIHFTGLKVGASIKRGDDLGYFAYGGSTVVALFQPGAVHFDKDLADSSTAGVETVVKVKEQIGLAIPGGRTGQK